MQVVIHLMQEHKLSERAACRLAGIRRSSFRYKAVPRNDGEHRARFKDLAAKQSAYGYLMLHSLLKTEALVVNKKRTYRIYTEEGLQVRTKMRKKLTRPRQPLEPPISVNQRWSMDFVSDQLAGGRRFRVLNVVDDYSREMVGQLASLSISGRPVSRFLSQLIEQRGVIPPKKIICDNRTEFTSKAMFFWSKETSVQLGYIQPGKPTQNAFVESLNGKFRNECLNQHWFRTLDEAKYEIDLWREHYNKVRPHSALGYVSPEEFARQAA
jgi:putative transposase